MRKQTIHEGATYLSIVALVIIFWIVALVIVH
jgi:hypothetical protein